jgi:predicted NBD/HSP70 family sugar kinase
VKGVNLTDIVNRNEAVVLNAIRWAPGGLSRVELASATGLAPQTVSNLSRRLLDLGLIEEGERVTQAAGKPRTMLKIRAEGRYAFGVHLDADRLVFVLIDFLGRLVASRTIIADPDAGPSEFCGVISSTLMDLRRNADVPRGRIGGAGVALPGLVVVDLESSGSDAFPRLQGLDFGSLLQESLELPVSLSGDIAANALGEYRVGAGAACEAPAYLHLSTRIGAAAIFSGEVFAGQNGRAGDLAHLVVDPDGPVCDCGQRGCAVACLTREAVVRQAAQRGLTADGPSPVGDGLQELHELVDNGTPEATDFVAAIARQVSNALVAVAGLMGSDAAIVGGAVWEALGESVLPQVVASVRGRVGSRGDDAPFPVLSGVLGQNAAALGAAYRELLAPREARSGNP